SCRAQRSSRLCFQTDGSRRSSAPPHAAVGIFPVKNRRETEAPRFCNRRFASTGKISPHPRGKSSVRTLARATGVVSANTLFSKILVTRRTAVVRFCSLKLLRAPNELNFRQLHGTESRGPLGK